MSDEEMEPLKTYSLQIFQPKHSEGEAVYGTLSINPRILLEAEENLSDLLPAGWIARIKEWDADE